VLRGDGHDLTLLVRAPAVRQFVACRSSSARMCSQQATGSHIAVAEVLDQLQ
jgi:hypothetical protein